MDVERVCGTRPRLHQVFLTGVARRRRRRLATADDGVWPPRRGKPFGYWMAPACFYDEFERVETQDAWYMIPYRYRLFFAQKSPLAVIGKLKLLHGTRR